MALGLSRLERDIDIGLLSLELASEPPVKYVYLTEEKMREIFEEHVMHGKIVEKYVLAMGPEKTY